MMGQAGSGVGSRVRDCTPGSTAYPLSSHPKSISDKAFPPLMAPSSHFHFIRVA
jgi:hypothetical protein